MKFVQAALAGSGRYQKYARQFITASTPRQQCGEYNQLTSQFPGAGPCSAVWAQTYPWFYRCIHSLFLNEKKTFFLLAFSSLKRVEGHLMQKDTSYNKCCCE